MNRCPTCGYMPRPKMVDMKKALRMRKQGKTLREIGEHFGVTKQAIDQLFRRAPRKPGGAE